MKKKGVLVKPPLKRKRTLPETIAEPPSKPTPPDERDETMPEPPSKQSKPTPPDERDETMPEPPSKQSKPTPPDKTNETIADSKPTPPKTLPPLRIIPLNHPLAFIYRTLELLRVTGACSELDDKEIFKQQVSLEFQRFSKLVPDDVKKTALLLGFHNFENLLIFLVHKRNL